jgi:hypothetical protein
MIKSLFLSPLAVIILCAGYFMMGASPVAAQDYSKPVERVYAAPYDSVWAALKQTVTDAKYQITVDKKREGNLETNVLMMVASDSVEDVMGRYGEVPFIASAQWEWGQSQLKCKLTQVDTVVHLTITAQLRAYDNYTTNSWRYFASNGKIESDLFDEVEKKMGR